MMTLPDAFISDPKFKADFQAFSNASSEEEKNRIIEEQRRWRASLTLDYIVQHYMGHTKEWLYQRMNGTIVNGKPARFKPSELEQLQRGIRDYGARLAAVSLVP